MSRIQAVVLDMDGVIVESEAVWDAVRRGLAAEHGRPWPAGGHRDMMGMNTPEWTGYMHEVVGVPLAPDEIARTVERRLAARYRAALPLIPGAVAAVRRLARRWPVAIASSSTRGLIRAVLAGSGLEGVVGVAVSSEEVAAGKPAPDVYLEACRRLGADPARSAAVEDSASGLRAAHAAGMRLVAVPSVHYPPPADALALADAVIPSMAWLWPATVDGALAP